MRYQGQLTKIYSTYLSITTYENPSARFLMHNAMQPKSLDTLPHVCSRALGNYFLEIVTCLVTKEGLS